MRIENAEKDYISRSLIKSKKRVADHGEVFTPPWLIGTMLDLTGESDRIESRFLEPACGNGNFLIRVLQRKLAVVEIKSRKSTSDKKNFALIALMSIYGIELLDDNIIECRKRLLDVFSNYLKLGQIDELYQAAIRILSLNIIHGDTLKMCSESGRPIVFSEWGYLGRGKFSRRDFRFDQLTQASTDKREIIEPMKVYAPMTVGEIARPPRNRLREVTL